MANLSVFNFENHPIQVINLNNEAWFIASEVAEVFKYRDTHNLTRILDDDEKGTHIMSTLGGQQVVSIINESGLYHAVLKSRKPEAKRFRKWATSEVLPQIRKTGSYINQDKVKRCYELANTVASKVTQDTFNKLMCSDEETIAGRWWVATGWRNGEPIATSGLIPRNAHIATLEELADRIERGDGFIATKPEEFAKLAHACMNAISRRINYLTTN